MGCYNNSIFGPSSNYLKFQAGDLAAISGASIVERLAMSDLRFPYAQLLKGRIILGEGQVNYLLNNFGLGDNSTFLAIVARYNSSSYNEEENYIQYNFANDMSHNHYMGQLMIQTGNSTNRIPQLYLTNPNVDYKVTLDVLVCVIDDTYSFFSDVTNQAGTSFTGLKYTDVQTYVVDESIVINDENTPVNALAYLTLSFITSIQTQGTVLIIDENSLGKLLLEFVTEFDALQAYSIINYVLENQGTIISNLTLPDVALPVIYFNRIAGSTGSIISFNGATSGAPYNTSNGLTFSASFALGTASYTNTDLIYLLVNNVYDNMDHVINLSSDNITVTIATTSNVTTIISSTGSYVVTFNVTDLAGNSVNTLTNLNLNLF